MKYAVSILFISFQYQEAVGTLVVRVTQCVHELAGFLAGDLGNHQGEQGVGGDEDYTKGLL